MNEIIKTHNLTKIYGQVRALSNVSLNIPKGATGLLGPNGAGKSTLIRTLIGLVSPSSGTGTIFEKDILFQGLDIRKRIGYMPEHECLILDMKAIEMVAYAGQLSGMPREDAISRAHEVLYFVGIGDERYRNIDTYSTGMKQKVNLAQALVHDPDLLLLDEPTNGLDPKGRVEMLELIKFLATEKDKSIVLSSHILNDVEHVCEYIVVLADGEILLEGNLNEQLGGEEGIVNVRAIGNRVQFMNDLITLGYKVVDHDGYIIRISQESFKEDKNKIFFDVMNEASKSEVQIRYVGKSAVNLEDLFIDIVERKGKNRGGVIIE